MTQKSAHRAAPSPAAACPPSLCVAEPGQRQLTTLIARSTTRGLITDTCCQRGPDPRSRSYRTLLLPLCGARVRERREEEGV